MLGFAAMFAVMLGIWFSVSLTGSFVDVMEWNII
jgi:hypothetical protein